MMGKPPAQVLLERYWEEASNQGKYELVRELCADPIVRHEVGSERIELSHDEQIARLKFGREEFGAVISRLITHADDQYVTSIWEITSDVREGIELCGIEVFKVVDGRLAECWNAPYGDGKWG